MMQQPSSLRVALLLVALFLVPSFSFGSTSSTGSCAGLCDQEEGDDGESCYCDPLCETFSDCCSDRDQVCDGTVNIPPPPPPPPLFTYLLHTTGGCTGRNELGSTSTANVRECADQCSIDSDCVSFEFSADGIQNICTLSSSCNDISMTVQDPNDINDWYLKVIPQENPEADTQDEPVADPAEDHLPIDD